MKTDLERFVELYASFGIDVPINYEQDSDGKYIKLGTGGYSSDYFDHEKFDGYSGF